MPREQRVHPKDGSPDPTCLAVLCQCAMWRVVALLISGFNGVCETIVQT